MTYKLCFYILQFLSSKYFISFSAWSLQSALGVENEGDNPIEWLKNSIPGTIIRHTHIGMATDGYLAKHLVTLVNTGSRYLMQLPAVFVIFLGGPNNLP